MLLRETFFLRMIGLTRIPFLFAMRPRVQRLDDEGSRVLVPLSYFTRNHVGSMYFGALVAGADCAGGLCAARAIYGLGGVTAHRQVVPIFKSLRADFLKLANEDVLFACDMGRAITTAVEDADRSGERVTLPIVVEATLPSRDHELVARFELMLSVKKKARRP